MGKKENITPEHILYSDNEFIDVVQLYQELLNMLLREVPGIRNDLNVKDGYNIRDIRRWLKDWSKQIFWDYLSATHWSMENLLASQFDKDSTFRCIKIIFYSWESITFINNPKGKLNEVTGEIDNVALPEWVLCFDTYRKRLIGLKRISFDELFMKLSKFERNHFSSESYTKNIWKILSNQKDTLPKEYNDKLALLLNIQPE